MVKKCTECNREIKWHEDTAEEEKGRDVCMDCFEKYEEKQKSKKKENKMVKSKFEVETEKERIRHSEDTEKEYKKLIKEYGGKFQAEAIEHLKKIRSYMGWILAIIIIGIIITTFVGCVNFMESL